MWRSPTLAIALTLFAPAVSCAQNAVTDWNAALESAEKHSREVVTGRSGAILHAAIFDVVNGVSPRYQFYYVAPAAPTDASREAAVHEAAFVVLSALYPAQTETFKTFYTKAVAQLPQNRATEDGKKWGATVARAILDGREGDGFAASVTPQIGENKIGGWRPVVPNEGKPGILPQYGSVRPFALRSPRQFRPAPPPSLGSPQYVADWEEVRRLGAKNSTERTAEQTEIARFNSDSGEIHWNRVARAVVKPKSDLLETARAFALLNIALADAGIYSMNAKYAYNYWRPITAIREAGNDDNPATEPDATWEPLLNTPMHPEYPSRHCAVAGTASAILNHCFGKKVGFADTSDALSGVKRRYACFDDLCKENIEARVLAGVHFRTADMVGDADGKRIASYVLATQLTRLSK